MQRLSVLAFLGLMVVTALRAASGCVDWANDCRLNAECCPDGTTNCFHDGGDGGDGGPDADSGPPPGCIPSENSKPVADSCGVFVSPTGDDKNAGTKEKPLKSFNAALAKGSTIYACAGVTPFSEAVKLDKPATIFGALDCGTWAYDAENKTALTAGADEIVLTIASTAGGSAVEDFAIKAADAKQLGGSSIAVVVDGVAASFTRTDITAGNGKDGEAGMTPTDSVGPTDPNDPDIAGNKGSNACMAASSQLGGDAKENPNCPAASGGPLGGAGGVGAVNSGSNGDVNPATPETALGGQGQPTSDPTWSCAVGAGAIGINGASGDAGVGAQSADLGMIGATGYTGVAGSPGGPGKPGQGGGGGGGAKGRSGCAGASGGGGGAGGCGGMGGTGGKAGGASIGIVSLAATLAFEGVTIKAGLGGRGGDGGVGQGGGIGGKGGSGGVGDSMAPATLAACDGGNGGQGGFGGQGGGGHGGHAIGIAYTGAAAPMTKGVNFTKGTPGDGGKGDGNSMGDGAKGVVADVQGF